jgi:hypothetical protein
MNSVGRFDVLAQLPYVLKIVIHKFITRPFIYQWLENGGALIEKKQGESENIQGDIILETVFL